MTQPEEQVGQVEAGLALPEPELSELAQAEDDPQGRDPSNTDVDELVEPLDDDDNIFGALAAPDEPTA